MHAIMGDRKGVKVINDVGGSGAAAPGSLSILHRTSVTSNPILDKRPGVASSSTCYRPGSIWLLSNSGEYGWMPTTCKTWRCKGCRDRMISLFKARVATGCSTLGACAFITITYKADVRDPADATFVRRDWKALCRRYPRLKSTLKWLRVMEVTRKGTPHHHLIAGPILSDERIRCWSGSLAIRDYERRFETCDCLAHSIARHWYAVTGDSYIIHTTPVLGAGGAAAYMAKYLSKTFGNEGRLKALGMRRRWSSARGWPGAGRQRLSPTVHEGWYERIFSYNRVPEGKEDSGTFSKESMNDAVREYFEKREAQRGARALVRRFE